MIQHHLHRAQAVQKMFENLEGIDRISVNHVTGSLVVHYNNDRIQPDQLLTVLKDNQLFDEEKASKHHGYAHSGISKATERFGKAVFGWCVGRVLDANGMSFLSAFI
jgi:hypothetical protein